MTCLADIPTALALLTRLPVRAGFDRTAQAAWAWPVVGLVVGGTASLAAWVGLASGLPAPIVAGVVLAVQIVLTGAMHEDGLADCADGFWGGFDRARRLEIMRDSHLGVYGAIALVLGIGLRWTALAALLSEPAYAGALVAAAVLSRAAMLGVAAALPHARADGLSVATGRPGARVAATGIALSFPTMVVTGPVAAFVALAAAGCCGLIARVRIGGQTGDVLGATQQMTEIAALLSMAAALHP